jgi:hypothetical protein
MLAGSIAAGSASGIGVGAGWWIASGPRGGRSALLGAGVAGTVLLVGLVGISLVLAGQPALAMAGAFVVYLGQLILLAVVIAVLRDAGWLHGRAFVTGVVGTTLAMQAGQVAGYARARHPMPDGAQGRGQR